MGLFLCSLLFYLLNHSPTYLFAYSLSSPQRQRRLSGTRLERSVHRAVAILTPPKARPLRFQSDFCSLLTKIKRARPIPSQASPFLFQYITCSMLTIFFNYAFSISKDRSGPFPAARHSQESVPAHHQRCVYPSLRRESTCSGPRGWRHTR